MNHKYKHLKRRLSLVALSTLLSGLSPLGSAFESDSTGADGAFTPAVDTELQLPPDGVLNFTNVSIPSGVTVTFARNVTNTPVTILATGDVTINGVIDVSGANSTPVGAAGDGNIGDDGLPGQGGPGGFDGGRGGVPGDVLGAAGLGPGAGLAAAGVEDSSGCGGSGGGFQDPGAPSRASTSISTSFCDRSDRVEGGVSYGSAQLLPLIGGSGGGGASAGESFSGSGGAGGGGALLIAASGTVTVNGSILANGGTAGPSAGSQPGGTGGGGSGGAIRIVASTIAGNGAINASGGQGGAFNNSRFVNMAGGDGAIGRIRLEADVFNRTSATTPEFSFAEPQEVFVAGLPALRITSVAGVTAPASPTGNADITLPENTPNPVTVGFATNGVPVGNTVTLTVTPASGAPISVVSPAITGTEQDGTASVSVDLPDGPSVLSAEVSFTVTVAMREEFDFSRFAQGESVEKVRLSIDPQLGSMTTLITSVGNEYKWPSNAIAFN